MSNSQAEDGATSELEAQGLLIGIQQKLSKYIILSHILISVCLAARPGIPSPGSQDHYSAMLLLLITQLQAGEECINIKPELNIL